LIGFRESYPKFIKIIAFTGKEIIQGKIFTEQDILKINLDFTIEEKTWPG
jgi:hypothetical protein